ncbi:MAG: asparagine synthase-related protein [Caldilineaceae bacterium]
MTRFAGVVTSQNQEVSPSLLTKMGEALAFDRVYRCDSCQGHDFGLVISKHIQLTEADAQILWNADRSRCVVLAGEIFDYQTRKQELEEQGHQFKYTQGYNASAEFILHLYDMVGEEFAAELNGSFAVAIYDQKRHELCLANGRLGVRPLYYAQHQGKLLFGSNVAPILADPTLPRSVNKTAVAELLTYEYMLNHHTIVDQISLLPPATILTWRAGELRQRSYWQLRFSESSELGDYPALLNRFIFYLRQGLQRQLPEKGTVGLNLSGGFDSRVALGLLNEHRKQYAIQAYTFGIPGCDDVRIAKELTGTTTVPHQIFTLNPSYLIENIELGVRLTDGMESAVHMHALANVKQQAEQVKIIYTGYILDSIISPDATEDWVAHYSDDDSAKLLYQDIRASFRQKELSTLFTDHFWQQTQESYQANFREAMEGSRHFLLSDWQNRFELLQRQRRFTQFGNELLNSHVTCRTPFADKDLVDFCLTLPAGYRFERKILRDVIIRCFHPLAKIPLDKTGYPLVTCMRDLQIRTVYQVKWLLINNHLMSNKEKPLRPYADYDLWMGNELHPWLASILLDKRSLDRGYLKPEVIRTLVSEQKAGAKHAKELGMLLSLELWHRLYID